MDQLSSHRGKLRDFARSLVRIQVRWAVTNAPQVVFKNTESGDTFLGEEKKETVITRFIGRLLSDLHFLDDFTTDGKDMVSFVFHVLLTFH